jgi:uncharacterized Zn-finger protein
MCEGVIFFVFFKDLMDRCAKFRRKSLLKGVHNSVCTVCGKKGFTVLTLRIHKQRVHNHRPCKHCMDIFEDEAALTAHTCPLRNITCDLCPKTFTSTNGWKMHNFKVHSGMTVVCDICGDQFGFASGLRRHMLTRHSSAVNEPAVLPCPSCGKLFKNRINLQDHERCYHKGRCRSGPCPICQRIFYSNWSLKQHMARVHRAEVDNSKADGPNDTTTERYGSE